MKVLLMLSVVLCAGMWASATATTTTPLMFLNISQVHNNPATTYTFQDMYEISHAVAALGGLANRDGIRLYVHAFDADAYWLQYLTRPGAWLSNIGASWTNFTVDQIPDLAVQLYNEKVVKGVVLYDGVAVPATSLVASTAAGAQSLLPINKRDGANTLYTKLVASNKIPVVLDLTNKFNSGNVTGSAKNDATRWSMDTFLKTNQSNGAALGYYIDYFWTTVATPPYGQSTVLNHDYFISKKGFFFDLDPWKDDAPNDDPKQKPGTDYDTLLMVLHAAYANAGPDTLLHVGGFPPWAWKYVNERHPGVATEWNFARTVSNFNGFMDSDACCIGYMANAAFYHHFPNASNTYKQNPAPTLDDLKKTSLNVLVNSAGQVCANKTYANFYVGDYDSSAWIYSQLYARFDDPARGKVPLGWAIDPMVGRRFPIIYDFMFNHLGLTQMDRVTSGDSGMGYTNPTDLFAPRPVSGLPSGTDVWVRENKKLFAQYDLNYTGFIINGDERMTPEAEALFCNFSRGGVTEQLYNGGTQFIAACPETPIFHEIDLSSNVGDAVNTVLSAYRPGYFLTFRTILQTASYHLQVVEEVAKQGKAQSKPVEFVEPLALALLARLQKHNGFGEC
eukprot:PhM_4_TR16445/c0_g1_i1/m.12405